MQFRLLGPVEVELKGALVPLTRRRDRAVLAVLLNECGHLVTTDRLIYLLWDEEDPPAGARRTIQAHVARLRAALTAESGITIEPIGMGYRLRTDPESIDAYQARRTIAAARATDEMTLRAQLLRSALDLWRGPPLSGSVVGRLGSTLCLELEQLRQLATEEWYEAALALGQHRQMAADLAQLAAERPEDGGLTRLAMLAAHRCGRVTEALALYTRHRQTLIDELGLEPDARVSELQQAILRDEPMLRVSSDEAPVGLTSPDQRLEAPAHSVRPQQLPNVVQDFTGRNKELGYLRTLLAHPLDLAGAARVVVITGMPGTGKTMLALRAAHEHRHEFPDGCLYADLRGTDAAQVRPETVLSAFLRSLGVTDRSIPVDLEERAALYRSVLADQRVLIFLDSAVSEAQVRPLLPAGQSCVLMTSTSSLSGLSGATALPLGVLPPSDGLEFLATLAGPDRINQDVDAAEEVVKLCDALPLALRVAGVRLTRRESMPVSELRNRLIDEHRRLDELSLGDVGVRSSLAVGYEHLTPPAARLLGLLSHTPFRTFGWDQENEYLLEELCAAQLLMADGNRIRMHDLVRLFARERVPLNEADLLRHYGFLLDHALSASACLPYRGLPIEARASSLTAAKAIVWFEDEAANLVAAVDDLLVRGNVALAGRLTYAVAPFALMRSGFQAELEQRLRSVLAAGNGGEELPTSLSIRLKLALAELLCHNDRLLEALPLLHKVYREAHFHKLPDEELLAVAEWSEAARKLGRLRQADMAMRLAFTLFADGRPEGRQHGYVMHSLGQRLAQYRRFSALALAAFDEAGEIYQRCADVWSAAVNDESIGITLLQEARHQEAALHLERSIAAHRDMGDLLSQTIAQQALTFVHLAAGDLAATRTLLTHTIPVFKRMRYGWGEATARRVMARVHLAEGDPAQALGEVAKAVGILRESDHRFALGLALVILAKAQHAMSDRDAARATANEALEILDAFGAADAEELRAWLEEWPETP